MVASRRLYLLGSSFVLAAGLLAAAFGVLGAAGGGGSWHNADLDASEVFQLVTAQVSPTVLYARTNGAGIWKSSDGAATWQVTNVAVVTDVNQEEFGIDYLYTSGVDASADGQVVFAARPWLGVFSRPGNFNSIVWRSRDGGSSWDHGWVPTSSLRTVAVISPSSLVLAGGRCIDRLDLCDILSPIFYSTDGLTWQGALRAGDPYTNVSVVAFAQGAGLLYAAGTADTIGDNFDADMVPVFYTSTNGITWTLVTTVTGYTDDNGNPINGFWQVAVDPSSPSRLFGLAGLLYNAGWDLGSGSVFSSTDGGASWQQLANQPNPGDTGRYNLVIDSQGRVYVTVSARLFRSTDQGTSWTLVGRTSDKTFIHALALDPNSESVLYFGSYDSWSAGVYKTPAAYQVSAATHQFAPANRGLRGYLVADLAALSNTIYAASHGQGVLVSSDAGQSWSATGQDLPNQWVDAVAVHPANPNLAYLAGAPDGNRVEVLRTTDGGQIWEPRSQGLTATGNVQVGELVIHPTTPDTLYVAVGDWTASSGTVYSTTDAGQHWAVALALTVTASSLAINPLTPSILYAGGDCGNAGCADSPLWKSTDGGSSWTKLDQMPGACVRDVLVNPITPTQVFVTECGGWLLRSDDDWQTEGLRTSFSQTLGIAYSCYGPGTMCLGGDWPGKLAYDTRQHNLYVAMGAYGLLVSPDDGVTWSKVPSLPTVSQRSVFYQPEADRLWVGNTAGVWWQTGTQNMFVPVVLRQ